MELELAERQARIDRELQEKKKKMVEALQKARRRQEADLELERKKKADHEKRVADLESSYRRRFSLIDEQLDLAKVGFEKALQSSQTVDVTEEEESGEEKKECDEVSSDTSTESNGSARSRAKAVGESEVELNKQDVSSSPNRLGQQCSGLEKGKLAAGKGLKRKPLEFPNDPAKQKSLGTQQTRELERSATDMLPKLTSRENAENALLEHMEATELTLVNQFAHQDPVSELPDGEERYWAIKKTEATNFPSKLNRNTISRTRRSRRSHASQPGLGVVQNMLARQRTAEPNRACPRITRMNGWVFAVSTTSWSSERQELQLGHRKSSQYSSDGAVSDGQLEDENGELSWLQSVGKTTMNQHQGEAAVKDPDKLEERRTLQDPENTEYSGWYGKCGVTRTGSWSSSGQLIGFGKSNEQESPLDVTGWGVTTAEMATLPCGVAPAVQSPGSTSIDISARETKAKRKNINKNERFSISLFSRAQLCLKISVRIFRGNDCIIGFN